MNLIDCSAEDIHGETRGKIDPHYVHCIAPRESERPEFENHRARVQPRNRCDYGSTARRSGTRATNLLQATRGTMRAGQDPGEHCLPDRGSLPRQRRTLACTHGTGRVRTRKSPLSEAMLIRRILDERSPNAVESAADMLGIGKMSALSKRVEHTVRKRIRERLAPDVERERNDALPSQ